VVYDDRLSGLVTWQQQLVMESLGKSVTRDGMRVDYSTSPVVWGGTGTPAEHTFFQALHQGTEMVPLDLIGVIQADHDHAQHHAMLLAHLLGQAAALTHGHPSEDPHARVPGNRPSTVILLDQLSPRSLGALLALQEHRMFVRAAVLDVNPFDQFGVELGKRMAADIESGGLQGLDPSMDALLKRVRKS
jgi:glucose-6-phosphate isomerase